MDEIKFSYKDYKIGQKVVCYKNSMESDGGFWDERLIVGEEYEVNDVDFHFPTRISVKLKGPFYHHVEFVPIELFYDDVKEKRDKKLKILLNEKPI